MAALTTRGNRRLTGTYRLQLTARFTFADAAATLDYLHALGVSHLYLSPVLQAAPGSSHGYDVVDHNRVSVELGGEEELRLLSRAARRRGMGLVADVVPNHMAVPTPESLNQALWSVLADGPSSPYARWFDINWEAQHRAVLMPVLGRRIGECLDNGEITLDRARGQTRVRYHDHTFPVRPGTETLPLPELLERQWYRLAYWRVADEELNYRRFFDIDTLAALRTEDERVFAATHQLLVELIADGVLDGLRVDHPDGLADPRGYLRRLAAVTPPGTWVVVEKILEGGEVLPVDWPCAGTTGYDAARIVGGIFVDPAGRAELTDGYRRLTGAPASFAPVAETARREVLDASLRAEVRRLVDLLTEICRSQVRLHDHTERELTAALIELLVAMPVYRTYCVPGEPPPPEAVAAVEAAAGRASVRLRARSRPALRLVADATLGRLGNAPAAAEFCVRFQQTSAPVMAKGVEDTALYRWSRLLCLNDVGGDPDGFGVDPADFHAFAARLHRDWPATLTTLSTHDTKRSEDVRARLAVLSELPGEWIAAVVNWTARSAPARTAGPAPGGWPDGETSYLLWQTLVGTWPISPKRLTDYLRKAVREAKTHTCWTEPDELYERAMLGFAERVLADRALRSALDTFVARIAPYARVNLLGQKLLQLAMPGVPDVYQGTECVTSTLVDPDNRRPVDYRHRAGLLAALEAASDGRSENDRQVDDRRVDDRRVDDRRVDDRRVDGPRVGGPVDLDAEKLGVTARTLRLRRTHPELFGPDGGYHPLAATGERAGHLVGFLRGGTRSADGAVAALATRLPVSLERAGGWGETTLTLPERRWVDALTGRVHDGPDHRVAEVLAGSPVALLVRADLAGPADPAKPRVTP